MQSPSKFVDSLPELKTFLNDIDALDHTSPQLFLDLEGENLSRDGTISILQIHVLALGRTYLFDVIKLQKNLFVTSGKRPTMTLGNLLENAEVPKVLFDCRNDADALYSHFGIALAGIQDVQLMELCTRTRAKDFVSGLNNCIKYDMKMSTRERNEWMTVKEEGKRLFSPEYGGSYAVFSKRPLASKIRDYCVADADILPRLWQEYHAKMTVLDVRNVARESAWRVERSKMSSYNPHGGREKARSNWPWTRKDPPTLRVSTLSESPPDDPAGPTLSDALHSMSLTGPLSEPKAVHTLQGVGEMSHASGYCDDDYDYDYDDDDWPGNDFAACSGDDCGWCGKCDY